MENRIIGIIPGKNKYYLSEIFGYTSKSIPGIEIIGIGPEGKHIKEKFVYLSKVLKIKIPRLRYVLCVENLELSKEEMPYKSWLELPLLILYFQLAGVLPIKRLNDCVATGRVLSSLKINEPKLKDEKLDSLFEGAGDYKILTDVNNWGANIIPLKELFSNYQELKIVK